MLGGLIIMKILRAYNNNIVLAEHNERKIVVVGSGIGFAKKEGDKLDEAKIETVFNFSDEELKRMNIEVLKSINVDEVIIISELIKQIEDLSQKVFNSSMIISLIDHINNSLEFPPVVDEHPMRWVIKRTNSTEYEMARWLVKELANSELDIQLPHYEVTSIALHLINNQSPRSMSQTVDDLEEINTIISMIEYKLNREIDKKSLSYSRFIIHLRFLLNRLNGNVDVEQDTTGNMYDAVYQNSPDISKELLKMISIYLRKKFIKEIDYNEKTYLLIYLNKILF